VMPNATNLWSDISDRKARASAGQHKMDMIVFIISPLPDCVLYSRSIIWNNLHHGLAPFVPAFCLESLTKEMPGFVSSWFLERSVGDDEYGWSESRNIRGHFAFWRRSSRAWARESGSSSCGQLINGF